MPRIGVPSRGSCFLRKTCPGKSHVSRVGIPSRGFCFLRITCPEKSYVSRVAVPSRGFCLPRKTCPAKNLISWVGYIGIGSFPFLCPLILKGRSWDPRQKSGPHMVRLLGFRPIAPGPWSIVPRPCSLVLNLLVPGAWPLRP